MSTETEVRRVEGELGQLLEAHGEGGGLDRLETYRDRPVAFIREVLEGEPWEKQREIARAVRDEPLVTVRSCHAAGKDWLAARLALWWCYARSGLVVLSGPTAAQVEEILMRGEIRDAFRRSGLPGDLHVRALRPGGEGRAGILARTAVSVDALTGFHSAEVLYLLTEAQDPEIGHAWDAGFAVTTGAQDRILTLGNPTEPGGRFYEAHQPGSDWATFRIEASDVPNVREGETVVPGLLTKEGVRRFASEYGEDSSYYRSRVLAEFPEEASDALVSRRDVETAFKQHATGWATRWSKGEPLVVGFDVARYGADKCCMAVRKGKRVRRFKTWGMTGTMKSVGRLISELHSLDDLDVTVVVDEVGVGGGIVDRLEEVQEERPRVRELIGRVVAFNSSRKARRPDRFLNARAETFWYLRQRLQEEELALPKDERLREELTGLRWSVNSSGRIKIEGKEDLRGRLGRSPDRADALALTLCRKARHSGGLAALLPM